MRMMIRLLWLASLSLLTGPVSAAPPQRIADLWYAHNAIVVMLGAADRVAVTVVTPTMMPWMYRVAPALRKATIVENGAVNAETLLAARVDLAFVSQPAEAARLNGLGIPTKAVSFTDAASFRASLKSTAATIATPLAASRSRDYDAYLDGVLGRLRTGLRAVPAAGRPRVLHLASLSPLRADGDGTLIDEWIGLAGGRNAAVGLHGNLQQVSIEQIAAWRPDIVIVGGHADAGVDHPGAGLPGKVVRNPLGVFPWDRYGPEFALQLLWAAKLLHPSEFAGVNLTTETTGFYRRFFNYRLSADEVGRILTAQGPPAAPR